MLPGEQGSTKGEFVLLFGHPNAPWLTKETSGGQSLKGWLWH